MTSDFLTLKPHCKKLNAVTLFVRLSFMNSHMPQFKYTHSISITKLIITELYEYDWNDYDVNHSKTLLSGYFILRQLKSGCV